MLLFLLLHSSFCENFGAKQIPSRPDGQVFHFQSFDDPDWNQKYFASTLSSFNGEWNVEKSDLAPHEKMIFAKTENAEYSLSTKFESPLVLNNQTLVIQYEMRLQESLTCGSPYLKVFGAKFDPFLLEKNNDYIIMFGPDRCGRKNQVVFKFKHKNSKTGKVVEHSMTDCPPAKNDKLNHLYALIIRPNNAYEILIDGLIQKQGSLFSDFWPPVNPPEEIYDENDKKPDDWVDEEFIVNPNAKKPDDWDEDAPEYIIKENKNNPPNGWLPDEPDYISDPSVSKPENWDEDFFGPWKAPLIANPKCEEAPGCGKYYPPITKNPAYKGKWIPPKIKNPAYKGKWEPRKIPNPDFHSEDDVHNFQPIYGIGFDFASNVKGIGLNNILISTEENSVHSWNRNYFYPKRRQQNLELKKMEPQEGQLEFHYSNSQSAKATKRKVPIKTYSYNKEQPQELRQALNDVILSLANVWTLLYNTNQIIAIVSTALLITMPLTFLINLLRPRSRHQNVPKNEPPAETNKKESHSNHSHRKKKKIIIEYSDGEEEIVSE